MIKIDNSVFPVLKTERLILQKMTHADAGDLFELRSNPDLMRYIPRPIAQNIEEVITLIDLINSNNDKNESLNWGFYLKENYRFIGNGGFVNINKKDFRGEIGYILHQDFHGKGFAHEAMTAIINFAFSELNFHSIEAIINPLNNNSVKLIERLHFIREGFFKDYFHFDGKFHDEAVYSRISPLESKI
jgi:[ribosomal protein S5]-alanine N-acetyltransferase